MISLSSPHLFFVTMISLRGVSIDYIWCGIIRVVYKHDWFCIDELLLLVVLILVLLKNSTLPSRGYRSRNMTNQNELAYSNWIIFEIQHEVIDQRDVNSYFTSLWLDNKDKVPGQDVQKRFARFENIS